jgi:hypothetical protein
MPDRQIFCAAIDHETQMGDQDQQVEPANIFQASPHKVSRKCDL